MKTLYSSSHVPDGFWYAYTDNGQVVGKDRSLDVAIKEAEAAGFTDVILAFGQKPPQGGIE